MTNCTAQDPIEIASSFLQQTVNDTEALRELSKHYRDMSETTLLGYIAQAKSKAHHKVNWAAS